MLLNHNDLSDVPNQLPSSLEEKTMLQTTIKKFIISKLNENDVFRNSDAYYWGFKDAMEKILDLVSDL